MTTDAPPPSLPTGNSPGPQAAPYPPYPPYPPFPPFPPYPPIVIVTRCECCHHDSADRSPDIGTVAAGSTAAGSSTTSTTSTPSSPSGGFLGTISGPPITTASTYDAITFTISVGFDSGDDGGSFLGQSDSPIIDSVVTASLYGAGPSPALFQTVALKSSGQVWSVFGDQVVKATLKSPVAPAALGSVTLTLIPASGSTVSLDLQTVEVSLSNPGGSPPPVTLLQTAGPVGQLTDANPTISLPFS